MGFIYVPKLLECFAGSWSGPNDVAGFVLECLKACAGRVLHLWEARGENRARYQAVADMLKTGCWPC